jgi:thiol-disulfide isomerase/thioredoxin
MKVNKYYLIAGGIILLLVVILLLPNKKNVNPVASKSAYDNIWVVDKEQLSDLINNRNERVLFVNVWATWCIPCIEEFPDLIKLHDTFSKKPVDFVSLNVNLLAEKDSLVVPFLEKNNSNLDVYMARDDDVNALLDEMDKNWSGAVPVTFIFDKKGNRKVSIVGKRDYKFFKSSIDSLLKFRIEP